MDYRSCSYVSLHNRANIKDVKPLTNKQYFVRGSTALLDAVGIAIDAVGRHLSHTPEPERPARVLFVITTDGMENASKTYSAEKVRGIIEHQKSKYSWEFLFLGADIDAIGVAADLGIDASKAVNFCHDSAGVGLVYESLSTLTTNFRKSKFLEKIWKDKIEKDHQKRGGKSNA